jgi:hypothetical protein
MKIEDIEKAQIIKEKLEQIRTDIFIIDSDIACGFNSNANIRVSGCTSVHLLPIASDLIILKIISSELKKLEKSYSKDLKNLL